MGGIERESCPKLLNLMPNSGRHEARRGQEEKKLELRLGPPGEPNNNNNNLGHGNNKELVGLLPARSRFPPQTQFSFDITSGKEEDFRKTHNTSSHKRSAPGPVVGWPPIRSFRKNNCPCPKPINSPPHGSKKLSCENPTEKTNDRHIKGGSMFVKINMEGVAIGRKLDLMAYDSYDKLSSAVDALFRDLLRAQRDNVEVEQLKPVNGEYTLVYEDNEGDRMLLGDVPWLMFLSTVKRLRVLKKTSNLLSLGIGGHKRDKIPQNEPQLMI